MEDSSSWTGSSWRLTGALSRLSERGMLRIDTPPIVVLLPSGKGSILPGLSRRHAEYGDIAFPLSQAHAEFVAKILHPYMIGRFRIKEGPENTATIGSSLGGQASLQLVLRYPEIFGGVVCLSPCFQAGTITAVMANLMSRNGRGSNNENETPNFEEGVNTVDHNSLRSKTIYIDNGGDFEDILVPMFDILDHFTMNEQWWNPGYFWLDTQLQPMIDVLRWTLDRGGVEYRYEKYPGGRHNERAWAQRIDRPLLHLYGHKSG